MNCKKDFFIALAILLGIGSLYAQPQVSGTLNVSTFGTGSDTSIDIPNFGSAGYSGSGAFNWYSLERTNWDLTYFYLSPNDLAGLSTTPTIANITNYISFAEYSFNLATITAEGGESFSGTGTVVDNSGTYGPTPAILGISFSPFIPPEPGQPVLIALSTTASPPSFVAQPTNVVVGAGEAATIGFSTTGTAPLSYQWFYDGTNIASADSNILVIPCVALTNVGTYSVVVSNPYGVASNSLTLSMSPSIVVPFTGAITYFGQSVNLSIGVIGSGILNYQWFDDGNAILGATNPTLNFSFIQATNAGLYSVVATSTFGSTTNTPGQVVVEPAGVSMGFYPYLSIAGVPGQSYSIQSSTNLGNSNSWVTLTNLTLTQSPEIWIDTSVNASLPGNPVRFYQVQLGP